MTAAPIGTLRVANRYASGLVLHTEPGSTTPAGFVSNGSLLTVYELRVQGRNEWARVRGGWLARWYAGRERAQWVT